MRVKTKAVGHINIWLIGHCCVARIEVEHKSKHRCDGNIKILPNWLACARGEPEPTGCSEPPALSPLGLGAAARMYPTRNRAAFFYSLP